MTRAATSTAAAPIPERTDTSVGRTSGVSNTAAPRVTRPSQMHWAVTARPFDVMILAAVFALIGLGVVMVYSASIGVADVRFGDPARYLRGHLKHVFAGLLAFALGLTLNYQVYKRYVYWILGFSVFLLLLTVAGLGINRGYSTRWIGPSFFEFQPSELAKVAFVVWMAYSLEKKLNRIRSFAIGFAPHLLVAGAIVLLCLMQPDLGTCLLLGMVMSAMLFVAGTRVSYIVGVLMVAIPAVASYIAQSSHRWARVLAWMDPWQDRFDSGFQTVNALTSLGSGGLTGLGLGGGRQKMGFLTQGWTDFVFASIGEELGLIGCAVVVALFALLCWRGYRAAWRAPDKFGRYLAFGLTSLIGIQAAFNMGVAVGLLPTKGLNLPFVSGGGSSMVMSCLAAGILLNVSRWAESPHAWQPLVWKRRAPVAKARRAVRQERPNKPKPRKPITQRDSGVRAFVPPSGKG